MRVRSNGGKKCVLGEKKPQRKWRTEEEKNGIFRDEMKDR